MNRALAERALPRPRDALGAFGLYVHIPFCVRRCWYCDFNAYADLDHLIERYMDALAVDVAEARSAAVPLADRPPLTSVFLGGGTPSLVPPHTVARVLDAVRGSWTLSPGAEVTIECNPESVEPDRIEAWLAAGVTRMSIGVQSLDDRSLASLGRAHDAGRAVRALSLARAAGVPQVSADLIYGIPGGSDDSWRRSLDGVLSCDPDHVSCYALTYEEGTPMHSWVRLGRVVPMPEDDVADRYGTAESILGAAGFERYEISNWARPGCRARHNELYWAGGEYLGAGAGAHSHLATPDASVRSWTVRAPQRYIDAIAKRTSPVAGSESLGPHDRCAEAMMLGLRRAEGVTAEAFEALTGRALAQVYGSELDGLARRGLVEWNGARVALTARGTALANQVVIEFLPG